MLHTFNNEVKSNQERLTKEPRSTTLGNEKSGPLEMATQQESDPAQTLTRQSTRLNEKTRPNYNPRNNFLCLKSVVEPSTYKKAMKSDEKAHWQAAMDDGIGSLIAAMSIPSK